MDLKLTQILVCPICKGPLLWDKKKKEFICKPDMKAFPVEGGIPVMLESEARDLTTSEIEELEKK